jgi:hypothetical protein
MIHARINEGAVGRTSLQHGETLGQGIGELIGAQLTDTLDKLPVLDAKIPAQRSGEH